MEAAKAASLDLESAELIAPNASQILILQDQLHACNAVGVPTVPKSTGSVLTAKRATNY